jgi:lauroyl/myristoyl acyltransferase
MKPSAENLTTLLRSRLPASLLPAVVEARLRAAWARPSVREDARAQMRFLLELTRPEADLESVARAYVRYQIRRGELRWHPDLVTRLRVVGGEHLVRAREPGVGVVLSFMHHGYYDGAFPSLSLGPRLHMVCYSYMLRDDAPAWLRQHVRLATTGGGVPVSADVGNDGIAALLARGEVVAIASDVPGRTPVNFAGRPVLGSFGAARLAVATGSPVVVMTTEEDAAGPFVHLHEPLDPERFDSPRELLERMLSMHESVILRWPEATDIPLSRWGTAVAPDRATALDSRGA